MRQGITLLMLTAFALTGCETMDSTMTSMKSGMQNVGDRIAAIDISMPTMPSFGSHDEEEEMDAAIASTEGETIILATGDTSCPPVNIVPELGEIHQFSSDSVQINDTLISNAKISRIATDCTVNKNNVALEINMTFTGAIGPDAKLTPTDEPTVSYPYFVALTTADGNIIAKEVFSANMSYKGEQVEALTTDSMRQIIPLTSGGKASADEILIGFQLTDDELAYNQANISGDPFDMIGYSETDEVPSFGAPEDIQPATGETDDLSKPISVFGE